MDTFNPKSSLCCERSYYDTINVNILLVYWGRGEFRGHYPKTSKNERLFWNIVPLK